MIIPNVSHISNWCHGAQVTYIEHRLGLTHTHTYQHHHHHHHHHFLNLEVFKLSKAQFSPP